MIGLWVLLAVIVVGMGYIRLAPSDPVRWHAEPTVTTDINTTGGAKRLVETGPDGLARLDAIARVAPRTRVLWGSVESGMVTYVTRSKVMGFPDYTTVQQDGDRLKMHGRLRFGRSDMGVNAARLDAWIAALQS